MIKYNHSKCRQACIRKAFAIDRPLLPPGRLGIQSAIVLVGVASACLAAARSSHR